MEDGTVGIRPSVRGILIRNHKIAMVYNKKYDCYTFPGGGRNSGESMEETLVREVAEEVGLVILPESIREYGLIVRREKGKLDDLFIQENYFFLCAAKEKAVPQKLDAYEAEEGYMLSWVTPEEAIEKNQKAASSGTEKELWFRRMTEREKWLLEHLKKEGYFD